MEYEDKFVLERRAGLRLLEALAPFMEPDPNAGPDGSYLVATLYFDSPEWTARTDALEGTAPRAKLRLRRYEGDRGSDLEAAPACRFELKRRRGRARTKEQAWTDRAAAAALARDPFGAPPALGLFAARLVRERPVVALHYRRVALLGRFDPTLRVTFDVDLRAGGPSLFDRPSAPDDPRALPPDRAVLELKHRGALPGWLRRLARDHALTPSSASKYRWALEACGHG